MARVPKLLLKNISALFSYFSAILHRFFIDFFHPGCRIFIDNHRAGMGCPCYVRTEILSKKNYCMTLWWWNITGVDVATAPRQNPPASDARSSKTLIRVNSLFFVGHSCQLSFFSPIFPVLRRHAPYRSARNASRTQQHRRVS